MASNDNKNGFLETVKNILVLYFLAMAIKSVYFDLPRGIYLYLFSPIFEDVEQESVWSQLFKTVYYYVAFLAIFFAFSLLGIAPFAVLALLLSWCGVFIWMVSQHGLGIRPNRFSIFCAFAVKFTIAWIKIIAFTIVLCVFMKLGELLNLPSIFSISIFIAGCIGGCLYYLYRRHINAKAQAARIFYEHAKILAEQEQEKANRDFDLARKREMSNEWETKRREQRNIQLEINAEEKEKRKQISENRHSKPTQAQLDVREKKRHDKRVAEEIQKKENDEQWLKELRDKGARAKKKYN